MQLSANHTPKGALSKRLPKHKRRWVKLARVLFEWVRVGRRKRHVGGVGGRTSAWRGQASILALRVTTSATMVRIGDVHAHVHSLANGRVRRRLRCIIGDLGVVVVVG